MRSIKVPSGLTMYEPDIELIKMLAKTGSIQWHEEPKLLRNGRVSRVYLSGREELDGHEALELLGRKIYATAINAAYDRKKKDLRQLVFIGIPTAGNRLARAAYEQSQLPTVRRQNDVLAPELRIIAKERAAGTKWLDRPFDPATQQPVFVENAVTSGMSVIVEGVEKLHEDGYDTKGALCVVVLDRQQGAMKGLSQQLRVRPLFRLLDVAHVLVYEGLWKVTQLETIRSEITQ